MPLRIKLPSNDRVIINGAVIENSGDSTTLIVHNRVDILRRKEVMAEEEATSPARRIYYALQCAYMFDEERSRYITHALDFLKQYRDAAPSGASIVAKIAEEIEEQRLYGALKATNELIDHETERLNVAMGITTGNESGDGSNHEGGQLNSLGHHQKQEKAVQESKTVKKPVIERKKSRQIKK